MKKLTQKLTSRTQKLTPNLDDVRKLKPDLPNVRDMTPDLSKVRKLAPNLSDLRKSLVPDLEKIQEISLSLEKVSSRLPALDDFGNVAKRWGDMSKLIPQWDNDDKAALSESQENEGFKKIQNVLTAPKAHKSLQESMEDVNGSIATTVLAFKRVGSALVEAAANSNENASDMSRFSDMWSVNQKEFIRLLLLSRETASRARSTAEKFASDLVIKLGDDALSIDKKNEQIQEYRATLETEMGQSKDLAQGFIELHIQITSFQREITTWMQKGDKLKEDIAKLTEDIKNAKEGIEKLTRQAFLSASSALGLGFLSAGAVALGILCPFLWIGAAFASVEVLKDGKAAWESLMSRKNKNKELQNAKNEMDDKLASLDEFKRIQVVLGPALSDLNSICDKLWVMSEMWTFIRSDLVKIEKGLELATSRPRLLKLRLKTAATAYSLLCDALRQYETAIGNLTELE